MTQAKFTPNCKTVLTSENLKDVNFAYCTWANEEIEVKETQSGTFVNGEKAQKTRYLTDYTTLPQWPGDGTIEGLMIYLAMEYDIAIETEVAVNQRKVFGHDNTPNRYNQSTVLLIKI